MKSTAKTPIEYINSIEEPRRNEIKKLHSFIQKTVPNLKPHMKFGILGYGTYHYKYSSGREGEWMVIGLANQKNYISLYACMSDGKQYVAEKHKKDLPKANIGKSCIRFRRLEDVDLKVIKHLLQETNKLSKIRKKFLTV
ncbi:MAG: DUF1801 domain-containing protein [Nitrosopumilus sp.]|nr:DUF1801 domain-containing protein [Nitrosopumilus sp.]